MELKVSNKGEKHVKEVEKELGADATFEISKKYMKNFKKIVKFSVFLSRTYSVLVEESDARKTERGEFKFWQNSYLPK